MCPHNKTPSFRHTKTVTTTNRLNHKAHASSPTLIQGKSTSVPSMSFTKGFRTSSLYRSNLSPGPMSSASGAIADNKIIAAESAPTIPAPPRNTRAVNGRWRDIDHQAALTHSILSHQGHS